MNRVLTSMLLALASASLLGCGDATARMTIEELIERGNECLRRGDHACAVDTFSIVLQREPQHTTALNNRAVAHLALERFDLAFDDVSSAIEISAGKRADSYIIRATLHQLRHEQEKALADVNRAIEINPKEPQSYRLRGQIYQSQNRMDEAQHDFRTADHWSAQRKP